MTDFLQRYGDQLRAAQSDAAGDKAARRPARVARVRAIMLRHPIALAGAVLLISAVPAAALVAPWDPSLSRPGIDAPVSTSPREPDVDASSWLAVLRRPQTAQDRQDSAPVLQNLGAGMRVEGVQTSGIRSLAKGWALVPTTSLATPDGSGAGLCLVDRTGQTCGHLDVIKGKGLVTSFPGRDGTEFAGLVPDGVAKVRFTPVNGQPVETDVTSNFYDLYVDQTSTSPVPVTPPPGYTGPPISAAPGLAKGQLEWLDSSGNVVGPPA
jgi:hypothetical protein